MSRRLRRSLGIYRTLCCFRPRPPICTRQCNGERALSRWRLWFMSVGDRFGALNFTSSSRRLAHSHGAYGRSVKTHASRRNAHARACTHSRTHARARARAHTHTHTHTHTHNTQRAGNKKQQQNNNSDCFGKPIEWHLSNVPSCPKSSSRSEGQVACTAAEQRWPTKALSLSMSTFCLGPHATYSATACCQAAPAESLRQGVQSL